MKDLFNNPDDPNAALVEKVREVMNEVAETVIAERDHYKKVLEAISHMNCKASTVAKQGLKWRKNG